MVIANGFLPVVVSFTVEESQGLTEQGVIDRAISINQNLKYAPQLFVTSIVATPFKVKVTSPAAQDATNTIVKPGDKDLYAQLLSTIPDVDVGAMEANNPLMTQKLKPSELLGDFAMLDSAINNSVDAYSDRSKIKLQVTGMDVHGDAE